MQVSTQKIGGFFLFLILSVPLVGQCPLPDVWGNIAFSQQAQIDEFPMLYPNCKNMEHQVVFGLEIENLHGLLGLETITGGGIQFYSKRIKDLRGLDSLRWIEKGLAFLGYDSLTSFEGLGNLRRVGSILLDIEDSPMLKNFKGLENLERVDETFEVQTAHSMESFEGLISLKYVGQQLEIHNGKMPNMAGFESLDTATVFVLDFMDIQSLAGLENLRHATISLARCDSLKNLNGLNGLITSGGIWLIANKSLESLDGLENLTTLDSPNWWDENAIYLRNNPKLHDLTALDHPITFTKGLFIQNNATLSACSVEAICTRLGLATDTVSIFGNLQNCNAGSEILSFCTSSSGDNFSQNLIFTIFPNPISENQPLHVLLENDFIGQVKVEMLSLDGRVISIFEREKTVQKQIFEFEKLPVERSFFLRVSDGKNAMTRVVLRH